MDAPAGQPYLGPMAVLQASIPVLLLLVILEYVVARARGHRVHRLDDTLTDVGCGALSQVTGIVVKLLSVGAYMAVLEAASLQRWAGAGAWPVRSPWAFVTVFLLVDFGQYISHRLSHRVNILWAGHAVHHSSEELNLTVALRNSSLHGFFVWVFFLPLAVAGVPWQTTVLCYGLNVLYQFWLHTREIGRLGPLEWVLNTPSHHRVHHAVNPRYRDRNFGGVLIIWDRVFGTFQAEDEPPVYGITRPLRSWNPVWANVHVFAELAAVVRRAEGWRERLRVLFGPPEALAPEAGPQEAASRFDPESSPALGRYAAAQILVVIPATLEMVRRSAELPLAHTAALGFYIALTVSNAGAVLERRAWVYPLELSRLVLLAAVGVVLLLSRQAPAVPAALAAAGALLLAAWLVRLRGELDGSGVHDQLAQRAVAVEP